MNKLELKNGTLIISRSGDKRNSVTCDENTEIKNYAIQSPIKSEIYYNTHFNFENHNRTFFAIKAPVLPLQSSCN